MPTLSSQHQRLSATSLAKVGSMATLCFQYFTIMMPTSLLVPIIITLQSHIISVSLYKIIQRCTNQKLCCTYTILFLLYSMYRINIYHVYIQACLCLFIDSKNLCCPESVHWFCIGYGPTLYFTNDHPVNSNPIDLIHKSHNGPVSYPTLHHFVTEMCTFLLQNDALWDICLMHCGVCEMGLLNAVVKFLTFFANIFSYYFFF